MANPTYKNTTVDFTGTGSRLPSVTVDYNFFHLVTRIASLEDNPPTPISIYDITGTDNLMTITLTDNSTRTITLPVIALRARGTWLPDTDYLLYDVVIYNGVVYLVTWPHHSASTFDPNANDGMGDNYYFAMLEQPGNTLPLGGTTNQVLMKQTDDDLIMMWGDAYVKPGGTTHQIPIKNSTTDWDWDWSDPAGLSLAIRDLTDVSIGSTPADGSFLSWNADSSRWTDVDPPSKIPTTVTDSSITYTPITGDEFTYRRFTSSLGVTITIPNSTTTDFAVDTEIDFHSATDAAISIVNAVGVTINVPDGYQAVLLGRHATATIKKIGANEWDLFGLLLPL